MKKSETPIAEILKGKIIQLQSRNKKGKYIDGTSSLFFETDEKKYFIKSYAASVSYDMLIERIGQNLQVKLIRDAGPWDSDDPNVQSRIGDYVIILQFIE